MVAEIIESNSNIYIALLKFYKSFHFHRNKNMSTVELP